MPLVKIYTMSDPITLEVRYIGKTKISLAKRRSQHISKARQGVTHRDCWLKSLARKGVKPLIDLIELVDESEWEERERHWISEYRKTSRLTNHADGGGRNSPALGELNHKARFSREDVREVVSLFSIGFSRDIIRSFPKYANLSDKTIRAWCQREVRASDTQGIPTRLEYIRSQK